MEGESGDENLLKHERKGFSPLLEEETTEELTHTWPRWGHGNFSPSFDVGGWFCSEWDSPILFSSQQFFLPEQYTMGRSFLSFLSFFRSGSGGRGRNPLLFHHFSGDAGVKKEIEEVEKKISLEATERKDFFLFRQLIVVK